MRRLRAFLDLTRPPNGLLMFIAVLAGVMLSDTKSLDFARLLLAFIASYALNGSSMGFNDYFDRDVDRVNAPHRPIPSGLIAPGEALILSSALCAAGLAASALLSSWCLLVASSAFLASFLYNFRLKRAGLAGNVVVSLVVAAPFIFGSVMSDGYVSARILVFIIPVILSNTGREVIKGMVDVEGDAVRDAMTLARVRGMRAAARVGAALYLAAVAVSPLPYLLGQVSWIYLPLVAVADAGFVYSAYRILVRADRERALRVKRETLLWMLLALIAFIAGGLQ